MAITTTVVAIIEGSCKDVEMGYIEHVHLRDNDVYLHATIKQEPGDSYCAETARLSFIRSTNFKLGKRYRVTVEEVEDDN